MRGKKVVWSVGGLVAVAGMLVGIGSWLQGAQARLDQVAMNQDEIETTQKAVHAIAEDVREHITIDRIEACEERCIPVKECPRPSQPLPRSRCEED